MPKPWSFRAPEDIAEMRRRLKVDKATLAEVGADYGISRQAVSNLVGKLNRRHPPGWTAPSKAKAEANRQLVERLARANKTDRQIAAETGLAESTVAFKRQQSNILHANRPTPEHSLWCLHKWVELFAYVPAATDWMPHMARKLGHELRAQRCEQFRKKYNCPVVNTVSKQYGSWSGFIRAGGYVSRSCGNHKIAWREAPMLEELPD